MTSPTGIRCRGGSAAIALALGLALGLLAAPQPARACTCLAKTAADQVKVADRILLVRADEPVVRERAYSQRLQVLGTLKGRSSREFLLERPDGGDFCDRTFAAGEVALAFVVDGRIRICDGNYALPVQLQNLGDVLRALRGKPKTPSVSALEAALTATLPPYLGARDHLAVAWPARAKERITIGALAATIIAGEAPDGVTITDAVARGPLHLLRGRLSPENVEFLALVCLDGKKVHVVGQWVDRPAAAPDAP